LLTKGADVNARDADGKTADDWATYYKHEQFAEQLRSLQESVNKDNREPKSR
jgi:ankyrin repeat protein